MSCNNVDISWQSNSWNQSQKSYWDSNFSINVDSNASLVYSWLSDYTLTIHLDSDRKMKCIVKQTFPFTIFIYNDGILFSSLNEKESINLLREKKTIIYQNQINATIVP